MTGSRPTGTALSRDLKIAYGLPAFALAVVGIPIYVHLPKFYTDVVGLNISWVGAILMSVRVLDAFTDPLMGVISDHFRSPMGRRRPFILWGSLCLAAAMFLLFVPPAGAVGSSHLWFGVTIVALFFCWTVVTVPYEALGPALTPDYTERTALFALRDGLLIAGTLVAAASPAIIEALQSDPGANAAQRQKFFWIALAYTPLLIGTCLWCVHRIREPQQTKQEAPVPALRDLKGVLRNRPFRILLFSYTIAAIGSNLPATLILFYVQYVLQSELANLFLLLYFAAGIVMLPAWIRLARQMGKKNAWLLSMAVNTCAFSGVFFLGAGDEWQYATLVVLSGMGFGATLALPSAIQADVIDYDEFLTGSRQEGWYIGIWSVVKKLTAALGVGIGLTVLGMAGYLPGEDQPPAVIQALKVLYALVPSLCNVAAFCVALAYPISQQAHQRIQTGIALRSRGEAVPDPLS
ncbi:MAG: MFS transporter [Desulfosarcinaceae bacterium]|nr:MFS transporter [Desulfosarcinaceae bacterium]